jgi:hypothetical protein
MAKHKVTVQEAAEALDTSVDAIRQRIKRGKLPRAEPDDPDDNRVYVWLDGDHAETRHHVEGEVSANLGALVESLQDQVEYLREHLDREREANRENRRLLAAALDRIPPQLQLEAAPSEPPGTPETAAEGPLRAKQPRPGAEEEAREDSQRQQEPVEKRRSWWQRMLGG